jgi:hypothetical protein
VSSGTVLVLSLALATASPAHADDPASTHRAGALRHRHAIYVELLGKGGWWGLGYDAVLRPRFALGATASFHADDGERVISLSPYAAIYPLGGARHRAFVQLGPQLVRLERMSPVPEWPGQATSGIGAQLSGGYELRTRVLVRAFGMAAIGKHGIAPWLGVSLGVTL